jgi:hypothetical protein
VSPLAVAVTPVPTKLIAVKVVPIPTPSSFTSRPSNFVRLTFITSAITSSRFPPLPKNAVALTIPVIFASPFTYNS